MLKYTVYQQFTGRMGGDESGPGGAGNTDPGLTTTHLNQTDRRG